MFFRIIIEIMIIKNWRGLQKNLLRYIGSHFPADNENHAKVISKNLNSE